LTSLTTSALSRGMRGKSGLVVGWRYLANYRCAAAINALLRATALRTPATAISNRGRQSRSVTASTECPVDERTEIAMPDGRKSRITIATITNE
jgi:hypothetical protein